MCSICSYCCNQTVKLISFLLQLLDKALNGSLWKWLALATLQKQLSVPQLAKYVSNKPKILYFAANSPAALHTMHRSFLCNHANVFTIHLLNTDRKDWLDYSFCTTQKHNLSISMNVQRSITLTKNKTELHNVNNCTTTWKRYTGIENCITI